MIVRPAAFGNEVLAIADLIYGLAKGKTTTHLCRSRVDQCVKRSLRHGPGLSAALVATEGDKIHGFLYAEERQLFDLFPNVRVVEVPFLVGGGGVAVPLLTRLREMTKLRIWVQNYAATAGIRSAVATARPKNRLRWCTRYKRRAVAFFKRFFQMDRSGAPRRSVASSRSTGRR